MGKKNNSNQNFEKALNQLEEIARKLESGELSLEESISEYEEGMILAKFCKDKLEEAERKIEILQKNGKNKEIKTKTIKISENTGEIDNEEDVQGSLL